MNSSNDVVDLPNSFGKFLLVYLRKYWLFILFYQIFCLAWSLENTLWPYIFGGLTDRIENYDHSINLTLFEYLSNSLLFAGSFYIFLQVMYRLGSFTAASFYPRIEANIRLSMFNHLQQHSHRFFSDNLAGKVANKIADMPPAMYMVLDLIITLFVPAFIGIIISSTIFFRLNHFFALLLISWVTIHIGACLIVAKKCINLSLDHSEMRSKLQGRITDIISNFFTVRAFANKSFEMQYVGEYQQIEKEKYLRTLYFMEKLKVFLGILNVCFGFILVALIIKKYQEQAISIGDVVTIINSSFNINVMVWLTGLELPYFFRQIGVCRQALSIVAIPHEIVDIDNAKKLKVSKGEIKFRNVTFHYGRGNKIFSNKSVTIKPKTKVGLVGYSGSGKTTFVNLILRNFEVESGEILIDGQNICKVTQKSLNENIAIIPQEPGMFHRSIRDNIRYGKIDATDEAIIEAATKANAMSFISKIENGLDFILGERGSKLSGGQRQRIAIARAILKDAPILILDEATSALDSITEKQIQEALRNLMVNKTSIVIAHRLSTLSDMDRIIVFDNGQIIEDWTHQELLKAKGHYFKMWNMQSNGLLPEF